MFIIDFITSPIGQIVCWGAATFSAFAYVLHTWLDRYLDCLGTEQRMIAVTLMSIFWMINVSMWFAATINWMLFSDFLFTVVSLVIFTNCRQKWAAYLTGLYCISFVLDICYREGLSQTHYAWLSNITYTGQLLTVSGVLTNFKQKIITP